MAKILLVEDDNNLREIYEARLMAEGYEIVSARDGEEALTVAMKEKPDLIISDVMMPKISGFDMLDILRSTKETQNAKVIMMTALSQVEDKQRAEKLGADRYLVKSQVTLEDVAKVAKEVLEGTEEAQHKADGGTTGGQAQSDNASDAPTPDAAAKSAPSTPPADPPAQPPTDQPADQPADDAQKPQQSDADAPANNQKPPATNDDNSSQQTQQDDDDADAAAAANPTPESDHKKVIQPINDLNEDHQEKLKELLVKEKEHEAMEQAKNAAIAKKAEQQPEEKPEPTIRSAGEPDATIKPDKPKKDDAPIEPPAPNTTINPNDIAL